MREQHIPTSRILSSTHCCQRVPPPPIISDADAWVAGPSMSQARCGLGVTAMPDGNVYAIGGYGGELKYLSSAEVRIRFVGYKFCSLKKHAFAFFMFLHAIFVFFTCFVSGLLVGHDQGLKMSRVGSGQGVFDLSLIHI